MGWLARINAYIQECAENHALSVEKEPSKKHPTEVFSSDWEWELWEMRQRRSYGGVGTEYIKKLEPTGRWRITKFSVDRNTLSIEALVKEPNKPSRIDWFPEYELELRAKAQEFINDCNCID